MIKTSGKILLMGMMLTLFLGGEQPKAQGVSADFSDGSVVFGTDTTACDPALEGAIRYNSVSKLHQFCDGVDWTGFIAFAPSVTLAMIPNSNLAMNVTGPGAPAYGAIESFQVKNFGATPSDSLTVNFSDPADNFDIISDGCTGLVLNQNDFCDITIRPKAVENGTIQASLTIPHNNAPSALLRGTASGFSCAAGTTGGGGKYVTCGAYNLVATPGGCTDSFYPTCGGGADTVLRMYGSNGTWRDNVTNSADGPQNSVNLIGYVSQEGPGAHPAAEYCMNMVYGGYDDWYLPSSDEILLMYAQRVALGGWSGSYITSRQLDASNMYRVDTVGTLATFSKSNLYSVRCVRRETQALPGVQHDNNPNPFFFPTVMTTASNRVTSATAYITSITQDQNISLSNDSSGGARIKINGGAEVTSGTVGHGDLIQLVMTAPGSSGSANTVDVSVGTYTTRWKVGVANASGTRRVFVSESGTGALGGMGGADARCQSEATTAGLTGTWVAIISDRTSASDHAGQRLDFNWAVLNNMNGDLIANGWNDLWDGSISNPINYDENGVLVTTNTPTFTDTAFNGVPHGPSVYFGYNCTTWTSGSSSAVYHYSGYLGGTGSSWVANTGRDCTQVGRLYCFENTAGPPDETPVSFEFNPMTKQAAASTTDVVSPTVTITGIDTAISVSVSGTGNPEYRINGGAWVTSGGTASSGDTLTIRADAPASNGSRNKITITAGTYTTYWYVGAGDDSLTKRIFARSAVDWSGTINITTMDSRCATTANAVGLGTNWVSLASDSTPDGFAVNKVNLNWGTIKNLNGDVLASSWEDLWDGALSVGVGYDENYLPIAATVRTASLANGRFSGNDCIGWTTSSSSWGSSVGASGATSGAWLTGPSTSCYSSYQTYCIESGTNADDTLPTTFFFQPMTAQAAASATDVESSTVTIDGIGVPVSVSVSGTGNPEYSINGGGWTSTGGTINRGDTLTVRADAPVTVNQRSKVTVVVGAYTTYFYVGAGNTANTKRIFVTSGTYNGARGGLGGADATCSSVANAAGLGTGWVALMSDSGVDGYAINRAPLDWGTLTNMNNDVVATSWVDLWDGSVAAPINRTQTNAILNSYAWTGSFNNGRYAGSACLDWTTNSNSNSYATRIGSSGSSGSWFDISGNSTCDIARSLYCIEQ
ncbi:MAG: hypothetical protein NDJ24_03255 [Alphaproteobacteria bacterium]|nr:hypothetical protein [Alphaproteobacteria bacterium]